VYGGEVYGIPLAWFTTLLVGQIFSSLFFLLSFGMVAPDAVAL